MEEFHKIMRFASTNLVRLSVLAFLKLIFDTNSDTLLSKILVKMISSLASLEI